MLVKILNFIRFLPKHRGIQRAIGGALIVLWLPVFALAQTLTVEMARGPLEDRRVRDAIMASSDWMRAAKRTGLDVHSVIIRHADKTASLRATPQDIEKAKYLLAESGGLPERAVLVLLFDARTEKLAQLVAQNLRRLQMPLKLVALPKDARERTLKMMRSRVDMSRSEPGFILLTWNHATRLEPRQPELEVVRPALLPDLEVSKFDTSYDPGSGLLTVQALVRNVGKGKVPSRFEVTFPESTGVIGNRISRQVAGPLSAGDAQWVEAQIRVDDAILGKWAHLRAQIHVAPNVRETNTRNNTSVERRVFLEPPPRPDLIITRIEPDYDRVTQTLRVRVVVQNVGKATAGPSNLRIVETQRRFAVPGVTIPRIAPGDSAMREAEVRVPDSALSQVALLEALVNADKKLREADYGNNGFGPVRVQLVPPPEPEQPDLIISQVGPDYDRVTRILKVRIVVRNIGKAPADPSLVQIVETQRRFAVPGVTIPRIAPGGSAVREAEVRVPEDAIGQVAFLEAVVNADKKLPEADYGNNGFGPVRVQLVPPPAPEQPDLVIDGFEVRYDPETGKIAGSLTVGNQGRAITGPFEVVVFDRTAFVEPVTLRFEGLAPGKRERRALSLPVRPVSVLRKVLLQAVAKPNDRVQESDSDNNVSPERSVPLVPPPEPEQPDLVIDGFDVRYDPQTGMVAGSLTVGNAGRATTGRFEVDVFDHSGFVRAVTLRFDGLAPGKRERRALSLPVQSVTEQRIAVLQAVAKPNQRVTESDSDNNLSPLRRVPLIPPPEPERPDLHLKQMIGEHDAARGLVVLRAVVTNIGTVHSAQTRMRFTELQDQMPEVDVQLRALAPDQQTVVHYEKPLAPSQEDRALNFVARVIVDPRVGESREDNNESQVVTLDIPANPAPLPDLVVTSLETGQARIGAPLEVVAQIANTGAADSGATGVVLRIDGADAVIEPLPVLRPNEVYTLRQDVPAQASFFGGTVEVSVEVDPENRIREITRANNLRLKRVALRPPLWPWIGVGGAGIAALLLLIRLKKGKNIDPPDSGTKPLPPHMRLQPRADKGRQSAEPEPGVPGIEFEVSLRPIRDTGHVTVETLTDIGETET